MEAPRWPWRMIVRGWFEDAWWRATDEERQLVYEGWIRLHRRLSRDYETLPASSEAMIHIASIDNLAKRITDETTQTWRGTY